MGIDILQVRGNGFVHYQEAMFNSKYCKVLARGNMMRAKETAYSGDFSAGAKKRLQRAVTIMAAACSPRFVKNHKGQYQYFRMAFLTLTFAAPVSVPNAKDMFNSFMRWIREEKKVRADIWKLEYNVKEVAHFHVLLADYVFYKECQNKWDEIQRKYGVTYAHAQARGTFKTNTVRIEHVGKVHDLAAYMMKELAKDINAKKVAIKARLQQEQPGISADELKKQVDAHMKAALKADGKVWDCSQNIRGVRYFSIQMTTAHQTQLEDLEKDGTAKVYRDDFFSIIKLNDTSPPTSLLTLPELSLYTQHVNQVFGIEAAPVEEIKPEQLTTMPVVESEILQVWTPIQMEIYF